jgi:hypothetical protein
MGNGKIKTGSKVSGISSAVRVGAEKPKAGQATGRPGSLVRVWFSNGVNGGDTLVTDSEFGRAPFVLIVEYVSPVRGKYGAKLKIQLPDR